MPHQCLKCGKVFQEGSAQLLKGCPDCGGNRFFFTKEPLDEGQRKKITEKVGNDINSKILELMGPEGEKFVDKSGNWVDVKPKDVRKAMEKHLTSNERVKPDKKEDIEKINDSSYRIENIKKIENEVNKTDHPETIDIERPGRYKIDLKGLLEEEPIIIQKDGTYTIHLPSLFKMVNNEKKD